MIRSEDGCYEGVGLPCGKRSCEVCRVRWARRAFGRVMAGMEGIPLVDLRLLTLTGPGMDGIGSADDLVAWNASALLRFDTFCRWLRRVAPACEFTRVLELQSRGAIHVHGIVRGASHLSERSIRRAAIRAGFGSRARWDAPRSPEACARYVVSAYAVKSRDAFAAGTRVIGFSRGWAAGAGPTGAVDSAAPAGKVVPAGVESDRPAPVGLLPAPVEWFASPPPGISWWEWAGPEGVEVLTLRRVRAWRRRQESAGEFERLTRLRYDAWLRGPHGRAALARRR